MGRSRCGLFQCTIPKLARKTEENKENLNIVCARTLAYAEFPKRGRSCRLRCGIQTGFWDHPHSCSLVTEGCFCGVKAAGAWSWLFTSIYSQRFKRNAVRVSLAHTSWWRSEQLIKRWHNFALTLLYAGSDERLVVSYLSAVSVKRNKNLCVLFSFFRR
jgi:hypothetical protein